MKVIEAARLGRRYWATWALRDCTLAIPAGRVAALAGPNGAGKTTLMHLAVGLIAPTEGRVTVLDGQRPDRARRWNGWRSWPRTCRCTGTCRWRT